MNEKIQELNELYIDLKSAKESLKRLDGIGLTNSSGYTTYDVISDEIDYIEERIEELKKELNIA